MSIPVVVGVTGHRFVREEDLPLLKETVLTELKKLKSAYPNSEFIMLNSIAIGADTICAEIGVSLGMRLVCPLPFAVEEYRKDFSGEDLSTFENLIQKAEDVFVAPPTEPAPDAAAKEQQRDYAYRQAGIYIAAHSHVLLALWDGKAGTANGCGAAEAVGFVLDGNYKDANALLKSTNDGAVLHVLTPRKGSVPSGAIEARLMEKESGSLNEILSMTDEFNRECKEVQTPGAYCLIPEPYLKADRRLMGIQNIYSKADAVANGLQKRYLSAMKWFSAFGVLLVLAFLLYDEMESDLFLPIYGLIILLYLALFLISKKHGAHMKFLQYRALAESMRVQLYLCAAGIYENIGNAFTWTQKHESTWVKEAAGAVIIGAEKASAVPDEVLKAYWIDDQLAYHKKALKRDSGKQKINEKTARGMLAASVVLFLLVFALEFFAKDLMTQIVIAKFPKLLLTHAGQDFTLRSLLKIVLGVVSAVTMFLSNYYDKLSFERKSDDHEKMIRLYQTADEHYARGDKEGLFLALAREEIIENGNWVSYCRENAPSFNL